MPSGCAVQNKQKPHCASLIVFDFFFSPQFTKTFMIIYFVVRGTKQITLYLKGINTAGLCCSGSSVCVYYCAMRSTYTHAQVHAENETPLLLSCFHLHCSARADGVRNPGFTSWNEKKQRERWEKSGRDGQCGTISSHTVHQHYCQEKTMLRGTISTRAGIVSPSLFVSISLLFSLHLSAHCFCAAVRRNSSLSSSIVTSHVFTTICQLKAWRQTDRMTVLAYGSLSCTGSHV